ncbi:migration and invasion inhibitory protein [Salarias fasciatus]|uniref:migration and invasion inhibitory protein n=1 Tax=Salarias fasciatus TaxID=181472 RepID=UPI0011769516|nr:migration and invasion-inhibitory protein [Salarias fasciatus]
MFSERLEALRERNKSLIKQLKLQRDTLERLSGCRDSRKREREDETEEARLQEERRLQEDRRLRQERRLLEQGWTPPEERPPEELVTVTRGHGSPARAALAKPSVRFADICGDQTDIQESVARSSLSGRLREGSAADSKPSDLFRDRHQPPGHSGPVDTKTCSETHSKDWSGEQSGVRFQSDECEDVPATGRHHLQPLLGYDWIAGVLDTDESLMERSDDFFNDLRVFRSLNKDECVRTTHSEFSEDSLQDSEQLRDKDAPQADTHTHQCTFSYRINSRLFPVPLGPQECCPVCKRHKSRHPHTTSEPALVRVSIPRSALLPPHRYKPHRRCSFDPSDSLGLPSHCLSGWSNTGQTTLPPPSCLDLHSSLDAKARGSSRELENLSEARMPANRDEIADVSRLARHNFQHFSAKRKASSTSYRVC